MLTNEGAQWPSMGKKLIQSIPFARKIIQDLDQALASLPVEYRPTWSLVEQLMLQGDSSNVKRAEFSQPLCTAIQVLLVKLLTAAGVAIHTVVGHSSGEIACAFVAGYISAAQAIRIAYLRGVVSKAASAPDGSQGAMLAAGISLEEAQELCALDMFAGRLCVAASNAPDSVTLSGDAEAIEQVQAVLEDETKFARRLRVDKAYHSYHMLPCAQPYVDAMNACGCGAGENAHISSVTWFSSVHAEKAMAAGDVSAEYWKDNLLSTVRFSQAVALAAEQHPPPDAAVEVGCHPALKGPCLATMQSSLAGEIPYTGCMERGEDDLKAFTSAIGYLWEHFGSGGFNVDSITAHTYSDVQPGNLSKQLPRYAWDNHKTYWAADSRKTRAHLHREKAPHPLLGTLSSHSTASTFQWHNFIRVRDMPWLDGHQLQGQTVFPGAAYAVIAMEGGLHMAAGREVQLLEVLDLRIGKAVTFEDENSLVEINLTLDMVSEQSNAGTLVVRFNCDSSLAKENSLTWSAGGRLVLTFGPSSPLALPLAQKEPPHMTEVKVDDFYAQLERLGYGYAQDFRALRNIKRVNSRSRGTLAVAKSEEGGSGVILHPATLDVAFQAFIGAFCMPGDGRLRALHLPVSIARIAVNPGLSAAAHASLSEVCFNSAVSADDTHGVGGDVEVFATEDDRSTIIQIEQIRFKPFTPPSAADDRVFFAKMTWLPLDPDRLLDKEDIRATSYQKKVALLSERLVYFYCRRFLNDLTNEDRLLAAPHCQSFIHWTEHVVASAAHGQHYTYDPSWDIDTAESLQELCNG